jgi:cytochrome c oxidase subunit 3
MREARPAFQYATLPQQQEAARLGICTFLASEVLFFGGLLLAYAVYRYGYPDDFAAAARHS